MGKRVEPRNKIMQRGIGFNFRQHEFFNRYRDFKPDSYCRAAIDMQIKIIDPEFLEKEENSEKKIN